MLSYRHAFHAGNFADVLKHVVLVQVLAYLKRKDAPLLYLDTHAGAGVYDLGSARAGQTGEFRDGIGRLWTAEGLSGPLRDYLEVVRACNSDSVLARYPGSPWIARRLLRPNDRLELCELHKSDFAALEQAFGGDSRVHCHARDGFTVAAAKLPPIERRGLVFIDPSYELKDDYAQVVEALLQMHRRFATGVYALWYPLVDRRLTEALAAGVASSGLRDVLRLEFLRETDPARPGLRGCGMFVVNPPWTLQGTMAPVMEELSRHLAGPAAARATVEQFVPE